MLQKLTFEQCKQSFPINSCQGVYCEDVPTWAHNNIEEMKQFISLWIADDICYIENNFIIFDTFS